MSDISQGSHVKLILAPGEVYRVSSPGTATVDSAYGAPAGQTVVSGATVEFGPYASNAKLTVTATSGTASYMLKGFAAPVVSLATPASGTAMAVRASQASNGNLVDQGPNRNPLTNSNLIPAAWTASATVPANAYRTPVTLNGFVYKATSGGGGTNAASEPVWPTVVGNTVVSNAITYTCEKGPYFVDGSGIRLFRSIASSQLSAAGVHTLPAQSASAGWDMAQGQSIIVNLRIKFDYTASGQAAAQPIFSSRDPLTSNRGLRITATGTPFNDLRVQVFDGVNSVFSGNMSQALNRKPLDGVERNVTILIDGVLKMGYFYIDGIPHTQGDMNTAGDLCPHNMNLATVTGSTLGAAWTIGGNPGATSSVECAFKTVDLTVLSSGLPANILAIAQWYARGGEGVLPQALLA